MLQQDYIRELIGLEYVIITGIGQEDKICSIYLEIPRKLHKCPKCGGRDR